MGKSIHGMRARSRDRARAHHNGRVSSRLFLTGCSPAEPASASPADATLRLHPPQCQRNFIERYFVTVLVVSAQGSTARNSLAFLACRFDSFHANFAYRRQANANFSLGRSGKVTMRTSNAVHRLRDGTDRLVKPFWDGHFLPRRANRTSAEPCQLSPCPFRTSPDPSDRERPETGVLFPVAVSFHRWSHLV